MRGLRALVVLAISWGCGGTGNDHPFDDGTSGTSGDDTRGPTSTSTAESTGAPTTTTEGETEPGTGTSEGSSSETTTGVDPTSGTDTLGDACECAPSSDRIYVLGDLGELWSFDPETNQFELITAFDCGGWSSLVYSMAVDRNANAWIMFQNADVWTVDINNPVECTDPGYEPGQMGFNRFGMAFVSESEGDPCDQLYAHTWSGMGAWQEGQDLGQLGVIDPETLTLQTISTTDYDGGELTGTGDGRMFLFAGVNPAKLVEVDKSDGQVLDVLPLGSLDLTSAFAFAFYAGDFYFFTESEQDPWFASKVTHLDYDDSDNNNMQDLTTIIAEAPIRIVGAGVSTCAPITPQ